LVERGVQRHLLGRSIARYEPSVGTEPRQPCRIEEAERGIGRGHQPAAIPELCADIAGGARRQPALEQRAAEPADVLADFGVADGGKGVKTPAEAAKDADICVSVVVNAAQTETILFGADGVAETLAKGAVFISSATMDPDVARRLAKQLEATGRHYLDAPISG